MRIATTLLLTFSLSVFGAGVLFAQNYIVNIDGAQPVPPTGSPGTGSGTLSLDGGKMLTYDISFSGLSGVETVAHIHGPAPVGANAGVQFGLPAGSPKQGTVGPLNAQQESDLNAGLYYVNIHSDQFPGGEIRGQIVLDGVPVEPTTWGRIKRLLGT